MAAEPTAECSYSDLIRIYRENSGLETLDECRRAIKALRQLYVIQPSEIEQSGDSMTMRDIENRIAEADKAASVFQLTGSGAARTPAIVPTDCLR